MGKNELGSTRAEVLAGTNGVGSPLDMSSVGVSEDSNPRWGDLIDFVKKHFCASVEKGNFPLEW